MRRNYCDQCGSKLISDRPIEWDKYELNYIEKTFARRIHDILAYLETILVRFVKFSGDDLFDGGKIVRIKYYAPDLSYIGLVFMFNKPVVDDKIRKKVVDTLNDFLDASFTARLDTRHDSNFYASSVGIIVDITSNFFSA